MIMPLFDVFAAMIALSHMAEVSPSFSLSAHQELITICAPS